MLSDELHYQEAACKLQWAMHEFLISYDKIGGKRKKLCNTPAIQSCLDIPDKTHEGR